MLHYTFSKLMKPIVSEEAGNQINPLPRRYADYGKQGGNKNTPSTDRDIFGVKSVWGQ